MLYGVHGQLIDGEYPGKVSFIEGDFRRKGHHPRYFGRFADKSGSNIETAERTADLIQLFPHFSLLSVFLPITVLLSNRVPMVIDDDSPIRETGCFFQSGFSCRYRCHAMC